MEINQFDWLPCTADEIEHSDNKYFINGVRFTEDFGPWKKGQRAESISIDFVHGILIEHDSEGDAVQYSQIKLVAEKAA